MERLTKPAVIKNGNKYVSAIGSGYGVWPRIIQRLAEYENTGLEPEEIKHRWIPVTERLPDKEFWEHQKQFEDEDLEVLVMIKGAKLPTMLLYNAEGEFYEHSCDGQTFYIVTHWMPKPEPPKED